METQLTDLSQYQHQLQQQEQQKKNLEVKQQQQNQEQVNNSNILTPTSPPSASSSPTHEFSFTVSLQSSSLSIQQVTNGGTNLPHHHHHQQQQNHHNNNSNNSNSFAVDLSPADEIFFHGHLLPLHLLSHLPVSPRSSTNSLDSFTLPIKELGDYPRPVKGEDHRSSGSTNYGNEESSSSISSKINIGGSESFSYYHDRKSSTTTTGTLPSSRNKPKSFSIFGWRKGFEVKEKDHHHHHHHQESSSTTSGTNTNKEKNKRKSSFDVSQVLKKYARMVRPLLFFKGRKDSDVHYHRQAYSFSDSSSWRRNNVVRQEPRGRRGELFSAPASMRTSPSNSGLLLPLPPSTSDSTMEELQAAIQAAIAHCKNSIATEEKIKF